MKSILLFLVILNSSLIVAQTQSYNSCCFCITDSYEDSSITRECKKALKMNKRCQLKKTVSKNSYKWLEKQDYSCKEVNITGAFHADTYMYSLPFDISESIARAVDAKKVNYDGSSCMIFNNLEDVKDKAIATFSRNKSIDFSITGNQNIGVVKYLPILAKPKESKQMSSKVTLTNREETGINISYASCSKRGRACALDHFDDRSYVDNTNTKLCSFKNKTVKQTCCVKNNKKKKGKWSFPGESCS